MDYTRILFWVSLVAQTVKNPPSMWETWVQSLGWEDPLEKGMVEWLPSPIFWPREFHGQRNLAGGPTKSQTRLSDFHFQHIILGFFIFHLTSGTSFHVGKYMFPSSL